MNPDLETEPVVWATDARAERTEKSAERETGGQTVILSGWWESGASTGVRSSLIPFSHSKRKEYAGRTEGIADGHAASADADEGTGRV